MTDPTADFFRELGTRGREPLLKSTTATIRFDITQGRRTERWCLQINKGALNVSTDECEADCVIDPHGLWDGLRLWLSDLVGAVLTPAPYHGTTA